VVPEPNRLNGTYTGIKWQCVEFARRWLLDNQDAVFGDVDTASDIWGKIQSITRVSNGSELALESYLNGSANPPRAGDLLIYAQEYLGTGHVAVVTEVDLRTGIIEVAEQNFLNQPWLGDYSRRIVLVEKGGRYWVLDGYVLGWKRVKPSPSEI
jgi:glutathionylspermidine amidase/synthetase